MNKLRELKKKNTLISYPGIRYSPPGNTPFEPYASPMVQTKKQTSCHKIVVATRDKFMWEITAKIQNVCKIR